MSGPRRRPTNRQRVEDYYGVHDTGMNTEAPPAPAPPPPAGIPAGPPPAGPPVGAPSGGPTVPPQRPASAQVPPRTSRVIPPPEVQVAAKAAAQAPSAPGAAPTAPPEHATPPPSAPSAPSAPEPPRSKPDPLTDPLTSETFQGVAPEPDTFDSAVSGGFGFSTDAPPAGASAAGSATGFEGGFDAGFDQFAPPRFEPRADREPDRAPDHEAEDPWTAPDQGYTDFEPGPSERFPSAPGNAGHASDSETFEATFATAEAPGAASATETLDEPDESYIDVEVVDVVEADHEPAPAPQLPEPLAIDPFPYTQIDETYVDADTLETLSEPKEPGDMTEFNESLKEAMNIEGALGVALVDAQSGMTLATAGDPADFNLEVAAAGNSALVQAMSRTLGDLDLDDHIEDILITLGTQYQIVRPIRNSADDLFLYLVLDRSRGNLAMARFRLTKLAEAIEV